MELSFVVIGLNESAHLQACFDSVRAAALDGIAYELIYVDGGSTDGSLDLARAAGVDLCLGGERKRRAAENRNLGLHAARGEFVQFLDGDMALDPAWPKAALADLRAHSKTASVFGQLRERRTTVFYRALQIDWTMPDGEALYCGGASMFRAEALRAFGGFPEDVAYGEEPYLCWRMRNEGGWTFRHLHRTMALHDLAYRGFADYWRRTVRVGMTFAEIAHRCRDTREPLWTREVRNALLWPVLMVTAAIAMISGVWILREALVVGFALLLLRKAVQHRRHGWDVAFVYAVHTYLVKAAIAQGIVKWRLQHLWSRAIPSR